jgi:hypothetical protein
MPFLDEAIAKLAVTPTRASQLVDSVSEERLSLRPDGAFFSLRENVAHLRDVDVEGYEKRIARIFTESNPTLANVDGARLARERDYLHQPVPPALAELRRSRTASLDRLRVATEADLERTAVLEGTGGVTLRKLLEMWLQHDAEHLEEMERLRVVIGDR